MKITQYLVLSVLDNASLFDNQLNSKFQVFFNSIRGNIFEVTSFYQKLCSPSHGTREGSNKDNEITDPSSKGNLKQLHVGNRDGHLNRR